jgi:serine/threonine protein kinase
VARERRVITRWLITARSAQITLLAAILLNIFAMPPARDAVLDGFFSRESFSERVGGVFGAESKWDRRRAAASTLVTFAAWFSSCGIALLLWWLHLPNAVRDAHRRTMTSATQATLSNRYRIEAQIGRGASGIVHRATDVVLNRRVALKEMAMDAADEDSVVRFRREAQIVAQLNHPNIVQVYDLVDHADKLWIAMELVEGGDLADLIAKEGRLNVEDATDVARSIASAISYAHDRDIVHRDLKPLNVLLDENGVAKVTDFGLAKLAKSSAHTIEGTILGSPHYMSPEQADGKSAGYRSDVYSLGVVIYHMLAGKPPFQGEISSVVMQHVRRPAPRLRATTAEIPKELEAFVLKMMAKDPADRPESMHKVSHWLTRFTTARIQHH